MRPTLVALLSGLCLTALTGAARADLRISVDKAAQQMSVAVDGQTRYVWPVSTGAGGYDTPSGSHQPFRMEANHFSREWDNAPMPHAIFFTKLGHAIHGTGQVRNLGRAASHGCVRLSPGNAATLFGLVKAQGMANTRVIVDGAVEPRVAAARPARRARAAEEGSANADLAPVAYRVAGPRVRSRPAYREPYADPYADRSIGRGDGRGFWDY